MIFTIIGFTAAVCTTFSFLPQIIKSYQSKSTRDISWGMIFLLLAGAVLWLVYGVSRNDLVVMAANGALFLLVLLLLAAKVKYK